MIREGGILINCC